MPRSNISSGHDALYPEEKEEAFSEVFKLRETTYTHSIATRPTIAAHT
jgi:hypothetical protein